MFEFIQANPFFSGAFLMTIMAAILAYIKSAPSTFGSYFWARFSITIDVPNSEPAFHWLSLWLHRHEYSERCRRLRMHVYGHGGTVDPFANGDEDDREYLTADGSELLKQRKMPRVVFAPAPGEHVLRYRGKWIWLQRVEESKGNTFREIYRLCIFGRDRSVIQALMDDLMQLAYPPDERRTNIITPHHSYWQEAVKRYPRTKDSVILPPGEFDALLADVKHFLASREWYYSVGIPYRRGYLLYGKAGSGKTSTVLAIAGETDMPIYALNLGDWSMDDGKLSNLLSQVPHKSIVLLEDIDAIFTGRKKEKTSEGGGGGALTFSGLLNALDGVAATEGRLVFMTTNHKENLDPALIRPGRADYHLEYKDSCAAQAEQLYQRFFGDGYKAEAFLFGKLLQYAPDEKPVSVSMAQLQDLLLRNRNEPLRALEEWKHFIQEAQKAR